MPTNVLTPNGLLYSRTLVGAPTSQLTVRQIKAGYASAIGVGDLVKTLAAPNQGYLGISAFNDTAGVGVFVTVYPYFDKTFQGTQHGLNGSYQTTSNPSADIPAAVIMDPFTVFRAQVSGGPWAQTWLGNNINWLTGTNGVPNAAGISTLALDGTTVGTSNTLPFRIVGLAGTPGGPQDPANTNPYIEVTLNPAWIEMLQGTGI
jgi:hypothetical protein